MAEEVATVGARLAAAGVGWPCKACPDLPLALVSWCRINRTASASTTAPIVPYVNVLPFMLTPTAFISCVVSGGVGSVVVHERPVVLTQ